MNTLPIYQGIEYIDSEGKTIAALEFDFLTENESIYCVVSYDDVKFVEIPDEDGGMLEFNYILHEGHVPEDDLMTFKKLIGDFLVDIITTGIEVNK
jgi:hypothetical protein